MEESAADPGCFGEAEYAMEIPLPCPHCHQPIQSVVIVRLAAPVLAAAALDPHRDQVAIAQLGLEVAEVEQQVIGQPIKLQDHRRIAKEVGRLADLFTKTGEKGLGPRIDQLQHH